MKRKNKKHELKNVVLDFVIGLCIAKAFLGGWWIGFIVRAIRIAIES